MPKDPTRIIYAKLKGIDVRTMILETIIEEDIMT